MPMTEDERRATYAVVAARHAQWDNLLWQIPVLSMTAQAFLFSIALDPGSSQTARVISAGLSLLTLFLSATSMARQRQGALVDAEWLSKNEQTWDERDRQYGLAWKERRDNRKLDAGWQGAIVPRIAMFRTWIVAFLIFAVADFVIIALALWAPQTLA